MIIKGLNIFHRTAFRCQATDNHIILPQLIISKELPAAGSQPIIKGFLTLNFDTMLKSLVRKPI